MSASALIRSETPPHHPTFGVHVPAATIADIVRRACPGAELLSVRRLESGKSYNNRIYFIVMRSSVDVSGQEWAEQELVLKANGRFFAGSKVENEVASLRIMEAYCPGIPVPRVLGWSCDGVQMELATHGGVLGTAVTPLSIAAEQLASRSYGGWILMSKLQGTPLSERQLGEEELAAIMTQLADLVATWRTVIPSQWYCGNTRLCSENEGFSVADLFLDGVHQGIMCGISIRGILMDDVKLTAPIATLTDYYRARLERKLQDLEAMDTYAPHRSLIPQIKVFADSMLSKIGLDAQLSQGQGDMGKFVFTHYDLAPRNILLSDDAAASSPIISGLVDFEFSGFFAPLEEFLNDAVGNEGDWTVEAYEHYRKRLVERGVSAPPGEGIERRMWDGSLALERLVSHIAPWWLPGGHEGEELGRELAKAKDVVEETLKVLEGMILKS